MLLALLPLPLFVAFLNKEGDTGALDGDVVDDLASVLMDLDGMASLANSFCELIETLMVAACVDGLDINEIRLCCFMMKTIGVVVTLPACKIRFSFIRFTFHSRFGSTKTHEQCSVEDING